MAQLELTFTPDYVDWGIWEAVRELLQNAKDADDLGFDMDVKYYPRTERLEIINEGAALTRDMLVLGATSKRNNDSQRGQFGEGFKLAFASLLRMGREVTADVGSERWTPEIKLSDTFGREVMVINTHAIKDRGCVTIEVSPVTPSEWERIQGKTLFMGDYAATKTDYGEILTDDEYAGMLFCKDLFVGGLPDEDHLYGYNLKRIQLDRDRRLADPYSVRNEIQRALLNARKRNAFTLEQMYKMLETKCAEADLFDNEYDWLDGMEHDIAHLFKEKHSKQAIPVYGMSQAQEAEHYGLKGIEVASPLRHVLERSLGNFEDRKENKRFEVTKVHNWFDLDDTDAGNLVWARDLLQKHVEMPDYKVVDFRDEALRGTYEEGEVKLARDILEDRAQLIAAFAHEISHAHGKDGTVGHREATEQLLAKVIADGIS